MISKWLTAWLAVFVMAAMPASNNFQLNSYGFGNGGTADSSSTNYRVNGVAGEAAGSAASTNYKAGAGEAYEKQANVPTITISNDADWYNKLKIVIGPQNNPSDAKFAVAISSDNFTTTQYVKSDLTVGSSLSFGDYQPYAAWGGGAGAMVRGLQASTVYTVKAKAYRGEFTESGWGPTASVATVDPQLSFDIDVSTTDTSTNPPYQISFGSLLVSTVTDSPSRVWVSLATNGESGGKVYLSGQNGGLKSLSNAYVISSQTGDLSSLAEGFGAQGLSATQTSGGPFALTTPYDGTGTNVGVADALIRVIFTAPGPLVGGRGSFILKAKTQPMTPASADYTETLTAIASASF